MLVSFDVLGDKDGLVEHLGTSSTTSDVMAQTGHGRVRANEELIEANIELA